MFSQYFSNIVSVHFMPKKQVSVVDIYELKSKLKTRIWYIQVYAWKEFCSDFLDGTLAINHEEPHFTLRNEIAKKDTLFSLPIP